MLNRKMRFVVPSCVLLLLSCGAAWSQNPISEPGPTFRVADSQLPNPLTFIAYGDQRFTDPTNSASANPRVRAWLANQIVSEKPAAVILNGDVPLHGDVPNDYVVFRNETKSWRDAQLRVFPTLGNHELSGVDEKTGIEAWWTAFPELRNRRWYSVALGSRIYVLALDSQSSLLPGSEQAQWIEKQIGELPKTVDFVVISMHHPPVADVQKRLYVDHNPRPNEIALRDYLSAAAKTSHARFLVSAGHIHNYERSIVGDVVYLVAGGGGAAPYFVERTPQDLYQSILFPNFHYVKFTLSGNRLHGDMYRVADPEAPTLAVAVKDSFEIDAKPAR